MINKFKNRFERKFELKFYGGVVGKFKTDKPIVAITFDDGPHPKWTPAFIDLLNKYDAKATFFVIGKYAHKYPDIVERAYTEGHAIGNHSWDHPSFLHIPKNKRYEQLYKCDDVIDHYNSHKLFRPPFGHLDGPSRRQLLKKGYKIITWNRTAEDWKIGNGVESMSNKLENLSSGSVLLLHDTLHSNRNVDRSSVLVLVEKILSEHRKNFKFVTIPYMFEHMEPKITYWEFGHPLHNT